MLVALTERARAGDHAAFRELVDIEAGRCFSIAFRIVRDADRARDAVQRALVTAWRDLPQLRDPLRFQAWLYRLLVRECWRERKHLRAWTTRVGELSAEHPAVGDFTVSVEERDALERAFSRLSIEHRAVFVLHHHAGLSLAEIADAVGAPIGTVKSRLYYARQHLRAALGATDRVPATEGRPA